MDVGMLWFDSNQSNAVTERVRDAASYYREKYGKTATLCFVHPSALTKPATVGKIEIRPMDTVLPNHFWLGVKPKQDETEEVS